MRIYMIISCVPSGAFGVVGPLSAALGIKAAPRRLPCEVPFWTFFWIVFRSLFGSIWRAFLDSGGARGILRRLRAAVTSNFYPTTTLTPKLLQNNVFWAPVPLFGLPRAPPKAARGARIWLLDTPKTLCISTWRQAPESINWDVTIRNIR